MASARLEFCAMADAIQIDDLQFSYGDLEVFRGLSLRIPVGQVVAILGASGSGKSTLLKLIGGQLAPSAGTVKVAGANVHELSAAELYRLRREMGMMFQNGRPLHRPHACSRTSPSRSASTPSCPRSWCARMVLMKLHAVGLRGARDMMPGELSGGMTRRVALARAIAPDPKLMMYDEPFAGLDPISLNHDLPPDPRR